MKHAGTNADFIETYDIEVDPKGYSDGSLEVYFVHVLDSFPILLSPLIRLLWKSSTVVTVESNWSILELEKPLSSP